MYIIEISIFKKNTLFHVSDFSGNIKFFYSAGSFQQKGKGRKSSFNNFKKFYKILVSKLKFLKKFLLHTF
jgi:ribosomal protein S11